MSKGILRVHAEGITVDLSHLTWMKPPFIKDEIQEFFRKHGYAEAEKLPYSLSCQELIVKFPSKEAQTLGWHQAIDADGIPF